MKVVTLCENRLEPAIGLKGSHGLSLYIEHKNYKLLYDTGQDEVFLANAKRLGIDLKASEKVIISHGHFDHAGGLLLLEDTIDFNKVVIAKEAFTERLRLNKGKYMDIGVSNRLAHVKHIGTSIKKSFKLTEDIWCLSNVPVSEQYVGMEKGLFTKDACGSLQEDTFEDELNLVVKTSKGLVVISGCSHRGIINILEEAQRVTQMNKIHTFIGGMHLTFSSKKDILDTINEIKKFEIKRFIVGHCTGLEAIILMKEQLPKSTEIINNYVGYQFDEGDLV